MARSTVAMSFSSRVTTRATPSQNATVMSYVYPGRSGITTWRPVLPEVFSSGRIPIPRSTRPVSRAMRITCVKGASFGSRSITA